MTTKLRGSRLEAEVDRARTEGNWKRVSELISATKSKHSGMDYMQEVLEAETLLEQFLEQQGDMLCPRKENVPSLKEADKLLREAIDERRPHPGVVLEAHLLLAKLHYSCADYPAAIADIENSGMDSANTPFRTLRALRLVAEAYSIKGLSIESTEGAGTKRALFCFEKAAELAICYVSELEKAVVSVPPPKGAGTPVAVSTPTSGASIAGGGVRPVEKMGELLECSLERVAVLRQRQAAVDGQDGIEWYRRIISSLGDKYAGERLQQRLSVQLAELLYRAIPDPHLHSEAVSLKSQSLGFYTGSQKGYFSPASKTEEILLLLLISEVLTAREVVLSRSDEASSSRHQSLRNAKSVYNLLTLVLSSLRQYQLLSSIYERAMKFANQDRLIWFQFAMSLLCRGRWLRASRVLAQCLSIDRKDENAFCQHMLAAQLHIEHLGQFDIAINHAESAMELADNVYVRSRSSLLKAIAMSQQSLCEASFEERKTGLRRCIDVLEKCVQVDSHDYLSLYYCALQYAIVRDLDAARDRCARSLELNAEQPSAIMLLALIFTADGDMKAALELVLNALKDFPNHYGLLVLRMHIEKRFGRIDEALDTSAHLLEFWKKRDLSVITSDVDERYQQTLNATDAASLMREGSLARTGTASLGRESTPLFTGPLGIPTPGLVSLSTAGSQLALDMSDSGVLTANAASEIGGASTTTDSQGMISMGGAGAQIRSRFRAQANIWLSLAELFLSEGRLNDVTPCVEQAVNLFPNSHQALYLKGRLLWAKAERATGSATAAAAQKMISDAKAALLSALAISPSHVESLSHLAMIYKANGNVNMAEQMYKELVRIDPLWCEWWQQLGEVFADQDQPERAMECFKTAASLDRSTPILPFTCIPLVFPTSFA